MKKVGIVGLGLIGGSIGIALRAKGWRVSFEDRKHVTLTAARAKGAADERGIKNVDITVIATPVATAIKQVRNAKGLTTSVCSVMAPLRAAARGRFVAGHPMAGSQDSGLAAARGDLFEYARWFVDDEDELVAELIRDCGAIREVVDAKEHDAAVALTSHLPQVLSTALAAYLSDREDLLPFAAGGLKTFLRLAGSDAKVWTPILAQNKRNIAPHVAELTKLVQQILDGDAEAFEKAQRFWRALS